MQLTPDPQQEAAIEHLEGPVLVVAGAGTGKTTVLIRRIAMLIREGHARPDEIVALTYTDNAAKEMLSRVQREVGGSEAKGLQITTFHAYCNHLLHRAKRQFQVLDDKQLWIFLRRNLRELRLNYYVRAANTTKFLDDLLDFIRRCHDELVGPAQYREYVRRVETGELPPPRVSKSKDSEILSDAEALGRCREIAFVFEKAESMLRERGFGTFGHMILRANELLAENPAVLDQQRRQAKFILVDEFQDANYAQIKVLEKLAGPERNVFAVGDPDQGIYRFRGASSAAFELFQKRFPEAKLIVLSKNRRSTTPILKCAFVMISQNPEFALRARDALYGRAPLVSARDEADTKEAGRRSPVSAVLVSSTFMEAADLVSAVLEHKKRSRCDWKDIGVLYRSHFHRDDVAAELARNGIPFTIEGLDVLDTPEARDLAACLGAAISDDSAALLRIAAWRQFAVDPHELSNAMKGLPRESQVSIAALLPKIHGGVELLNTLASAREAVAGQKVYAALLAMVRLFQVPRSPAIEAMLQFANQWERSPITESGAPAEFLEYLGYFREARGVIPLAFGEDENSVRLMTAHSAKGLEFDHVFIVRAVKGSFPSYFRESLIEFPRELRNSGLADDDEKQISDQEERRLFYVAMTRARDTLTIYGQFGRGKTERTPAGYIRELLKNRELKSVLQERKCREFQTDIFAAEEPQALSRIGEWVAMPPSSDLASTLSASAIQSYEMCPLQFKLEREWRIPSEVSGALQYGAAMHRALLSYYDSVRWERTLSEAELVELLREDLAAGFADEYQRELYEKKGAAEIHEFLRSAEHSQPEVLHTEERFTFRIGDTNVVGRIDRIDRSGDCVVITDYKTGRAKTQEDADESLQLSIYAMAAHEKWGYRADRLVFHNLDGNTQVVTRRSDAELNAAAMKVTAIAGEIAAGKFDAKPGIHCGFCAYRVLCPKTEKRIPETLVSAAEPGH